MSRRIQITVSDADYEFLNREADRSSVSIAELMRRAYDNTYGARHDRKVLVITHTLGRRAGRRLD